MNRLEQLLENQKQFQKLVGMDIDTNLESVRNKIAEGFAVKIAEEAFEMRKEFPSIIDSPNNPKDTNFTGIKSELCDVILYIINFCLVFKIDIDEVMTVLEEKQSINFRKIKAKSMEKLNEDILKVQNHTSGVGQGNISPKYIFIGQNPGKTISHGYKFFSIETDGSSQTLLPALKYLNILDECYFTNVVKSTTDGNAAPDEELASFWTEFLDKELDILLSNNPNAIIVTMGKWTDENVKLRHKTISHPSYIMRKNITTEEYANEIQTAISSVN